MSSTCDSPSTKWVSRDVRKANMSLRNRLQSIIHDSHFISSQVSSNDLSQYPIIPNERCGLWYASPEKYNDTAYFKSTDGHSGEWSFSMRRLNLHLWPILRDHGGISIIDSSRRRLIPDSLLKAVPIWCAVLNSILYGDIAVAELEEELIGSGVYPESALFSTILNMYKNSWVETPSTWVSVEERLEISYRINGFVKEALASQVVSKEKLLAALGGVRKPLVPRFYYPDGPNAPHLQQERDSVYFINCMTASRRVSLAGIPLSLTINQAGIDWIYIQGAADDHELWITSDLCDGDLNPAFFWKEVYSSDTTIIDRTTGYLSNSLQEQDLVNELSRKWSTCIKQQANIPQITHTRIEMDNVDTGMIIGSIMGNTTDLTLEREFSGLKHVILFSSLFQCVRTTDTSSLMIHQYQIDPTKKGAKMLRRIFEEIVTKVGIPSITNRILILDSTGTDICSGMGIVLLCLYYDFNWKLCSNPPKVNKQTVKRHLAKLCELRKINPSRNTLQSVHSFLIPPEKDIIGQRSMIEGHE